MDTVSATVAVVFVSPGTPELLKRLLKLYSAFVALLLKLVAVLPENLQPGPGDLYGLPWEPVLLTTCVGILMLAIFLWRNVFPVKERIYQVTEQQIAEKVKTTTKDNAQLAEKLSSYEQKINQSQRLLQETKNQNRILSEEAIKYKDKIKVLEESKEFLDDMARTLGDMLECERKRNMKNQDLVLENEKSVEKLKEVISMNASEFSKVQVALNEGKLSEEKVKSECHQVQEENTRLKKKKLQQEVEDQKKLNAKLSQRIRSLEKSQRDLEATLHDKDDSIGSEHCIMQLNRLEERGSESEGPGPGRCEPGELAKGEVGGGENKKAHMHQLMDVSRTHPAISVFQKDLQLLQSKLRASLSARCDLEDQIVKLGEDLGRLQVDKARLEEEFSMLQQKVEVLKELSHQKELELQKIPSQVECAQQQPEQALSAVDEKVVPATEAVKIYKYPGTLGALVPPLSCPGPRSCWQECSELVQRPLAPLELISAHKWGSVVTMLDAWLATQEGPVSMAVKGPPAHPGPPFLGGPMPSHVPSHVDYGSPPPPLLCRSFGPRPMSPSVPCLIGSCSPPDLKHEAQHSEPIARMGPPLGLRDYAPGMLPGRHDLPLHPREFLPRPVPFRPPGPLGARAYFISDLRMPPAGLQDYRPPPAGPQDNPPMPAGPQDNPPCLPGPRTTHHRLLGARPTHHRLPGPRTTHHRLPGPRTTNHQVPGSRTTHRRLPGPTTTHRRLRGSQENPPPSAGPQDHGWPPSASLNFACCDIPRADFDPGPGPVANSSSRGSSPAKDMDNAKVSMAVKGPPAHPGPPFLGGPMPSHVDYGSPPPPLLCRSFGPRPMSPRPPQPFVARMGPPLGLRDYAPGMLPGRHDLPLHPREFLPGPVPFRPPGPLGARAYFISDLRMPPAGLQDYRPPPAGPQDNPPMPAGPQDNPPPPAGRQAYPPPRAGHQHYPPPPARPQDYQPPSAGLQDYPPPPARPHDYPPPPAGVPGKPTTKCRASGPWMAALCEPKLRML
nr:transport and Golgi organization protein 1 homolog [Cavia porcellus]